MVVLFYEQPEVVPQFKHR